MGEPPHCPPTRFTELVRWTKTEKDLPSGLFWEVYLCERPVVLCLLLLVIKTFYSCNHSLSSGDISVFTQGTLYADHYQHPRLLQLSFQFGICLLLRSGKNTSTWIFSVGTGTIGVWHSLRLYLWRRVTIISFTCCPPFGTHLDLDISVTALETVNSGK